jgi:hypothetical protein
MQSAFLLEQIALSGSGIAIAEICLFSLSRETSERLSMEQSACLRSPSFSADNACFPGDK